MENIPELEKRPVINVSNQGELHSRSEQYDDMTLEELKDNFNSVCELADFARSEAEILNKLIIDKIERRQWLG